MSRISCGCSKRAKKKGGHVPGLKSTGRADRSGRSPFSIAGRQPRTTEHVGPFGSYSPQWGYDKRTKEERRAGAGVKRSVLS
jgi:hypothetical protein